MRTRITHRSGNGKMKRKTNQRNAIQAAFQQCDRPLGIDEILDAGRRTVKSLNQATVYRNLKRLVEKGWLKKIHTPELGTLYEIAGKEHHHHFQCRSCDRLFEISGCAFNEDSATPPGFVTESHEVFLFGLCAGCRDQTDTSHRVCR
jgi:Fur family ferric uptake transcriptional regulator